MLFCMANRQSQSLELQAHYLLQFHANFAYIFHNLNLRTIRLNCLLPRRIARRLNLIDSGRRMDCHIVFLVRVPSGSLFLRCRNCFYFALVLVLRFLHRDIIYVANELDVNAFLIGLVLFSLLDQNGMAFSFQLFVTQFSRMELTFYRLLDASHYFQFFHTIPNDHLFHLYQI